MMIKIMWSRTIKQALYILFLTSLTACATSSQVKQIVANSNAAMINPMLNLPASGNEISWQDANQEIEALIAANSDQKVLVSHLRVRQAMLLTVSEKDNLAKEAWKAVVAGDLKQERDKALYQNGEALTWWYKKAPQEPFFRTDQEFAEAKKYISGLDATLSETNDYSTKTYLAIVRTMIAYRLRTSQTPCFDGNQNDCVEIAEIKRQMVEDVKKLFAAYEEDDIENARKLKKRIDQFDENDLQSLSSLNRQYRLLFFANEYKKWAEANEYPAQPAFDPQWVNTLSL